MYGVTDPIDDDPTESDRWRKVLRATVPARLELYYVAAKMNFWLGADSNLTMTMTKISTTALLNNDDMIII
jgi:hypothetical protein